MNTEFRIIAEMTDEQRDVLLSELINTSEIIGIKLKVESIKLIEDNPVKDENLILEDNPTECQIMFGSLYNNPNAHSEGWLFFEDGTRREFKVVESQAEILKKFCNFDDIIQNFYMKTYKAKRISGNTVEVILD